MPRTLLSRANGVVRHPHDWKTDRALRWIHPPVRACREAWHHLIVLQSIPPRRGGERGACALDNMPENQAAWSLRPSLTIKLNPFIVIIKRDLFGRGLQ